MEHFKISSRTDPIGFFDSGIGGLTIMREVIQQLPRENIVYLGDTEGFPYGDKSPEVVLERTLKNVLFLLDQNIKFLIIACFTASIHALKFLEERLSIPVIGVVQGGVDDLIDATQSSRVAVLGTRGAIFSGVLEAEIQKRKASISVFSVACPLLAPLIEAGFFQHSVGLFVVDHYLHFLKKKKIDAALIACTHYSLVLSSIQEVLGAEVRLIEPATSCIVKAKKYLLSHGLLNSQEQGGVHEFYVTQEPEKFHALMNVILGSKINGVKQAS